MAIVVPPPFYKLQILTDLGGQKSENQDGRQELIFDEKMTTLPVNQHNDHNIIVFIFGQNVAKYKDMSCG
jgi:hypothetical protein